VSAPFEPLPNAVWVVTDIPVGMQMKPGSVPKTYEDLMHFSDCLNAFLIKEGAQWAKYILLDENAKPVAGLDCDF